jgi:hypothetical protein
MEAGCRAYLLHVDTDGAKEEALDDGRNVGEDELAERFQLTGRLIKPPAVKLLWYPTPNRESVRARFGTRETQLTPPTTVSM